jgi:hypothetical protein
MVDRMGQIGIDIPQGIVRERGQMDDRIESLEITPLDVTHVGGQLRHLGQCCHLRAAEKAAVEPGHVVPRRLHQRREHGADIATMTRHQHSHAPRSTCL